MSGLTIYSASAGSGKTYTLTAEYLKLVFKNPNAFRSVMAVTFTNKATEEMKHRIIQELSYLANKQPSDHQETLMQEAELDLAGLHQRAQVILNKVLHQYSFFGVSTIDSFFQKIIRTFIKEVGLTGGFAIDLDQKKVLEKIVTQLFDNIGRDDRVTEWILKFAKTRISDGKSWNVKQTLYELADNILDEQFKLIEQEGFGDTDIGKLKSYIQNLSDQNNDFLEALAEIGKRGINTLNENHLSLEDFSYGKSSIPSYFYKLSEKEDFEIGNRVAKGIESTDKGWIKKKHPKEDILQQVVNDHLQPLLLEAKSLISEHKSSYYTNKLILDNIYVFGVYNDLIKELKAYRDENNVLLISDVTDLLHKIIGENDAPYVYEKVGNHYAHFLIDEFQDTSRLQWMNFEPLVTNSLAQGKKNLIVGDVKQAIYRWRGGDWKLLLKDVEEQLANHPIEKVPLEYNWRSERNVIDFNNAIFEQSIRLTTGFYKDVFDQYKQEVDSKEQQIFLDTIEKGLTPNFELAYNDVFQKSTKKQHLGYVQMNFLEGDKKEDYWESVQAQLIKDLESIKEKGYPSGDIAILVRNSFEGQQIADLLSQYNKENDNYLRFVSSNSCTLKDNFYLRLIVAAIKYLHDVDDSIALYELIYAYRLVLKAPIEKLFQPKFIEKASQEGLENYLPEEFLKNTSGLSKLPIYELCESIVRIFKITEHEDSWGFVQTFQDYVLQFNRNLNPDISTFLQWWEDYASKKSPLTSDSSDAIQIMTIHKSKGLQFKFVFIPFCNWGLNHDATKAPNVWGYTQYEPYNQYPYFPLKYKKELVQTIYSYEYFDELQQIALENLNILYVAFTRPEYGMFIYGNKPKEKKKEPNLETLKVNELLYKSVQVNKLNESIIDLQEFYTEDQLSIGSIDLNTKESKQSINQYILNHYPNSNFREKIRMSKMSEDFFLKVSEGRQEAINFGNIAHDILSKIESEKDIEEQIKRAHFEGKINEHQINELKETIYRCFENSQFKSWFETSAEVMIEQTILVPGDKFDKRPDRVLVENDSIVIIDFKFGTEKSNNYHHQIRNYGRLFKEMGYTKIEGYLFYAESNEVEKVSMGSGNSKQATLF